MGKHRRHDAAVLIAVQQYEQLLVALHAHQPGKRSGLCLVCGVGWPCLKVRIAVSQSPSAAPEREELRRFGPNPFQLAKENTDDH